MFCGVSFMVTYKPIYIDYGLVALAFYLPIYPNIDNISRGLEIPLE
jgi:hypothetical protein